MSKVNKIAELRDEASAIHAKMIEARDALKTAENGLPENETAEWKQSWEKMNEDYDSKLDEIEKLQDALSAENAADERLGNIAEQLNSMSNLSPEKRHSASSLHSGIAEWQAHQDKAVEGWLLNDPGNAPHLVTDEHRNSAATCGINLNGRHVQIKALPTREWLTLRNEYRIANKGHAYNVMQVGVGTSGGFTVGKTFVTTVEEAMLDFSGVLQVADVIRTDNGEEFHWPTVDDTSNTGRLLGEGQAQTDATDPTFGQLVLGAPVWTSDVIKVSRQLMQDSSVDIANMVGRLLGTRLGRIQNTKYTTGSGGGLDPHGIVTASALGVTAGSATAIAFDEIIDLEFAVDPAILADGSGAYMFHNNILAVLRKLKNGSGDYLWTRGTDAGQPDLINGYPYFRNQAMQSSVATGTKTVLFGSLNHYKVRQVANSMTLQRLVELYAGTHEDGFIMTMRGDGGLLNAGDDPVQHLIQA